MSSGQASPLTPREIRRDAAWLAQALDPAAGVVRFIAMDRASYRSASFLDDRLMQVAVDARIMPWPEVEAAVTDELRSDARWIFHIGHVGSTLLSRLLGELDGVLAIREPRLLRDLAVCPPEVRTRYLPPVARLMSRTFAKDETACVKATSFASEIAAELVPPGERALFMFAQPRNYVATICAGENNLKELRALAAHRAERLAERGIALPPARGDADRAAAAWACEMTALEAAAATMSDRRVEWADFDRMLAGMDSELDRLARFFGFAADSERLAAIAAGPLMQRYSKDLGHDYSARLRHDLITQELRAQGPEIEAALAMLGSVAEKSPLLARALIRAEE